MIELTGRKIDSNGNVIYTNDGLIELFLSGQDITDVHVDLSDENIQKFNELAKKEGHQDWVLGEQPLKERPEIRWNIPKKYLELDIVEFLLQKCETEAQQMRVLQELEMFVERDMIDILRLMIYLVDHFRENGVVWGVGRGSACASYCLYLIGIHKIDCLRYNIDISDFLR